MKLIAIFAFACLAGSLLLGGTAPLGRVALASGFPQVATYLFGDLEWRGVAQYRAGNMEAAAKSFRGSQSQYNFGNALTQTGEYAAALESFDLASLNGNADAQANFDTVAGFFAGLGIRADALALFRERTDGPSADSSIAKGSARAAGTGDEVTNTNTMLGLAKLESRGRQTVRRVFNDKFMLADKLWLEQLSDVPGEFLKARIKHERKRREKLGLSLPDPEDPR